MDKKDQVIKSFIGSFDNEDDQVALEHWYNHYVYPDDSNCWSRKSRIGYRAAERSESANRRVDDGTHNLLGGEIQRRTNNRRIEDGTHHFLGDKNPSHRRIDEGTHHFQLKKTCPHCGITCPSPNYARWHGDKCRMNIC